MRVVVDYFDERTRIPSRRRCAAARPLRRCDPAPARTARNCCKCWPATDRLWALAVHTRFRARFRARNSDNIPVEIDLKQKNKIKLFYFIKN